MLVLLLVLLPVMKSLVWAVDAIEVMEGRRKDCDGAGAFNDGFLAPEEVPPAPPPSFGLGEAEPYCGRLVVIGKPLPS